MLPSLQENVSQGFQALGKVGGGGGGSLEFGVAFKLQNGQRNVSLFEEKFVK